MVGESNQFAYKKAQKIAKSPLGDDLGKVFFIYGGVGVGKCHLMQAAGNHLSQSTPSAKILFTTSEGVLSDYLNALQNTTVEEFRNKYRNVDVLMLEAIHFLDGKREVQKELFHIFNSLMEKGARVLFTSDRSPWELTNFLIRMIYQFERGSVVHIGMPKFETRRRITERKAAELGLDLDPFQIHFFAEHIRCARTLFTSLKEGLFLAEIFRRKDPPYRFYKTLGETLEEYPGNLHD